MDETFSVFGDRLLVVLKSVAGYEWDPIHRNWIYPESQLESLEMALISIKDILSNVHIVPPLSSFLRSTRSESFPGLGTPEERSPAKLPTSQECGCNLSTSPPHPDKREKGSTTPNPKGTISILLYLIEPEKVAARSPYNERIKEAFQAVKGRHWNSEERVWMFPLNSLQEVVDSLIALKSPVVTVETLPPLVLPTLQASTENENAVQYEGQCTAHSSVKASSWKENVVVQEGHGAKDVPKLSITLFLHASTNIAAKFDYHPKLVGAFHMIPRASWHAKERLWMFPVPSLSSAEMILSEIDAVDVEVHKIDPLVRRALDAASAVSDLRDLYNRMPSFIEPKLLPFQRDGVRFLLQHGGRALLADEMGLGKTLQAIAFATCIRESWPVLVLTPSSLRLHWASMIQQWLNISSTDIVVVLSQYGGSNRGGFKVVYSNAKGSIQLDGFFNIISYDLVPKLQSVLLDSKFKTLELVSSLAGYETFDMKAFPFEEIVIADESHFLKNAQAKRTNASLPVLQKAQYVILLSGTPALSRPIELHKQLEALYPDVYRNVHEYGNRYCKGGVFGLYQGASNHEELHNLMKATVMIRRLKKDVLSELPVKRRQQVFLDLDEKDMKQIRALFRELEMVKSNIKVCKSQEDIEALKYSVKHLINKIYNDSAEAKIPAVLDYLGTVVEAGCKFLIFGHHQPMIESIHQFLLKKKVGCIRIDGGTPQSSRQALVTEFQEKDNIRAAVLSIKAGGVGLTLTAASTVIFAELSWTPGDIIQAEDRAHRIGQVQSVNIYYLLANDTVDDIIWDVIQGKLENLGQVLDGQENTLEVSVSQPKSSPAKQTAINMPKSSPAKQTTIDSFLKRCRGANGGKEDGGYPKCKNLRH